VLQGQKKSSVSKRPFLYNFKGDEYSSFMVQSCDFEHLQWGQIIFSVI